MLVIEIVVDVIYNGAKVDEEADRNPEFEVCLLGWVHESVDANTDVATSSDNEHPPSVIVESLLIGISQDFSFLRVIHISECHFRLRSSVKFNDSSKHNELEELYRYYDDHKWQPADGSFSSSHKSEWFFVVVVQDDQRSDNKQEVETLPLNSSIRVQDNVSFAALGFFDFLLVDN